MTDEELIARLRGDMPEMRPNRGWGWREDIDFVAVEEERKKAADRIEALVKERDALIAARDTMGNLWAQEKARAERLEAVRLEALRQARDILESHVAAGD